MGMDLDGTDRASSGNSLFYCNSDSSAVVHVLCFIFVSYPATSLPLLPPLSAAPNLYTAVHIIDGFCTFSGCFCSIRKMKFKIPSCRSDAFTTNWQNPKIQHRGGTFVAYCRVNLQYVEVRRKWRFGEAFRLHLGQRHWEWDIRITQKFVTSCDRKLWKVFSKTAK